MPVLRIMSVYRENKKKFGDELSQARARLEEYRAGLDARYGKDGADAVRQRISWTEKIIFGKVNLLPLSKEGESAVKTLRTLTGKVAAVRRKIRTPECWFHEQLQLSTPISVLETVGLSWRSVEERFVVDGRLPVAGVLRLLDVLRTTEQVMPTEEQVSEWAISGCNPCHLTEQWWHLLRHRRQRIIRLLSTAALLEEEVRCDFSR